MSRKWVHESPPQWNDDKQRVIRASSSGVFPSLADAKPGDLLGGDWWRVEHDEEIVGYGWMDVSWGDAEVLLAVEPAHRSTGVGTFILDHLEAEASRRGLRVLHNVIPAAHGDPDALSAWLRARGFSPAAEDGALLRRRVKG